MSRAGFVFGLLVMVQGAVGQTPVVVNFYAPNGPPGGTELEGPFPYTDIGGTEKTVNAPAGAAVIIGPHGPDVLNDGLLGLVGLSVTPSSATSKP